MARVSEAFRIAKQLLQSEALVIYMYIYNIILQEYITIRMPLVTYSEHNQIQNLYSIATILTDERISRMGFCWPPIMKYSDP